MTPPRKPPAIVAPPKPVAVPCPGCTAYVTPEVGPECAYHYCQRCGRDWTEKNGDATKEATRG